MSSPFPSEIVGCDLNIFIGICGLVWLKKKLDHPDNTEKRYKIT